MVEGEVEVFRLDPGLDVWDQQPGEPDQYFALFERYLSLPVGRSRSLEPQPRSMSLFVREVGFSYRHAKRLCDEFLWVKRAAAWDVREEHRVRGDVFDARVRLMREQVVLCEELLGFSVGLLREVDVESWRPRDVVELVKVAFVVSQQLAGLRGEGGSLGGVGVDVPLGVDVGVVEDRLGEVLGEVLARGGVSETGD